MHLSRRQRVSLILRVLFALMLFMQIAAPVAGSAFVETQAYIIQAADLAAARSAVNGIGARITHELEIIQAVGAELTPAQLYTLRSRSELKLYPSNPVFPVDMVSVETVRDEFNTVSYSNNDGTVNWASSWFETGDNGNPSGGGIKITSNHLLLLHKPDRMVHRYVNLPVNSVAVLSFSYRLKNFSSSDQSVALQITSDGGGSWTELALFSGPANEKAFSDFSIDISAYASPDTAIRFVTSTSIDVPCRFQLANIEIQYTTDIISADIVETVYDTFSTVSYSNNDGNTNWLGDWEEFGDDGSPETGNVIVHTSQFLQISRKDRGVQRAADLSSASSVILSLDVKRINLDNEHDYVALDISSDGGNSWTTLTRFSGPATDDGFQSMSFDITDFAAANTLIRFHSSPTSMNQRDKVRIDNLRISKIVTPDTYYPSLVGTDQLHAQGINGDGITVPVLDTG